MYRTPSPSWSCSEEQQGLVASRPRLEVGRRPEHAIGRHVVVKDFHALVGRHTAVLDLDAKLIPGATRLCAGFGRRETEAEAEASGLELDGEAS